MPQSAYYTATQEDSRAWRADHDSRAATKDSDAVASAAAIQTATRAKSPVSAIDVTPATPTLAPGATQQLSVATTPAGQGVQVTYSVDKPAVATVSATGLITAVEGSVAASKVLTSNNTNVSDNDTVTIGAIVYRFKNTMAQANDVKIGADADTSLANLRAAINGTGTPGTEYFAGTSASPVATCGAVTAHAVTVTAKVKGAGGNAIAIAESAVTLSWAGAAVFLSGGVGDTATVTATCVHNGAVTDTVAVTVT